MISYSKAPDVEQEIVDITRRLELNHIDLSRVVCIRSFGSKSRRTLARCHTISRIVQKSLDIGAHYIIEVIAEQFDRLPQQEKTKTLIHELLHIPKSFGGGFKHHDFVNHKNVEKLYRQYESCKGL
ncbi:MAG: metallopeptidase [Candidatus Aenigmarchaeota archaeon]|nr:metallopeptidase [Candidatus Aenigmarchaeota archaeon]